MIDIDIPILVLGFGLGLLVGQHMAEAAIDSLRAQLEAIKRMLPEVGP